MLHAGLARSCLVAARPEGAREVCSGETSHSASGWLVGTESNRCLLNAMNGSLIMNDVIHNTAVCLSTVDSCESHK